MGTTPHRQMSPGGKFNWDEERWVPVAPMVEEGFAGHQHRALRNALLGCLGLTALVVFMDI